jgi:GntR family transcriptional regulator
MVQKSLPLAQQVVNEILAGIDGGKLAGEGGLLPSEAELGQRFHVSRATVREALSRLEQRGVITRRHGVGTFVTAPAPLMEAGLEQLESLDTLARRIGLKTRMGAAEITERPAEPAEAEQLKLAPGAAVLSVARVIMANDLPVAYLVDVVPADLLRPADLGVDFNGSVLDVFLERGQPALSHSRTDITLEAVSSAIGHKLRLRRGSVLLKHEAQLFARDGRVVDYSLSYFTPGHFRFHVMRRINP